MQLDALIEALSRPAAYPDHAPDARVEVIQTHISVVFLIADEVFKIHKPVDFGFLDFTTLAARRRDCEAEVAVNRALAPDVYRGVVPVVVRDGIVQVVRDGGGGSNELAGEAIEWAVWMRRLPESATFASLLARDALRRDHLARLAARLATFYRDGAALADAHPELARLGDVASVHGNQTENFVQLADALPDGSLAGRLLDALRSVADATFERLRPRIRARFEAGQVRDTHGDLRLDHVYDLGQPGGLTIIDRIEFSDRFRWADPIADIAFLAMDLRARGAWALARDFARDFAAHYEDAEGLELLEFYVGYRAMVRAKVAAFAANEPELGDMARAAARTRVEARLRLALVALAQPRDRPCLILVGGLPGSGKSVLAGGLARTANVEWIRADVVRKGLAGIEPTDSGRAAVDGGIYSAEWTERTYAACLDRAAATIREGGRVVVDASFVDGRRRSAFVEAARAWGVPIVMLIPGAPPAEIRRRLADRVGDASDADWAVYQAAAARWDALDDRCPSLEIDTTHGREHTLERALAFLREWGLV